MVGKKKSVLMAASQQKKDFDFSASTLMLMKAMVAAVYEDDNAGSGVDSQLVTVMMVINAVFYDVL